MDNGHYNKSKVGRNELPNITSDLKTIMGDAKYDRWIAEKFPHLNNLEKQNQDAIIMRANLEKIFEDKLYFQLMMHNIQKRERVDYEVKRKFEKEYNWLKNLVKNDGLQASIERKVANNQGKILNLLQLLDTKIQHYEVKLKELENISQIMGVRLIELEQDRDREEHQLLQDTSKILTSFNKTASDPEAIQLLNQIQVMQDTNQHFSSNIARTFILNLKKIHSSSSKILTPDTFEALQSRYNRFEAKADAVRLCYELCSEVKTEIKQVESHMDECSQAMKQFLTNYDYSHKNASRNFKIPVISNDIDPSFQQITSNILQRYERINVNLAQNEMPATNFNHKLFDKNTGSHSARIEPINPAPKLNRR